MAESKIERKSASESRFESHGVVIARRAIARLWGERRLLERGEWIN